MITIDQLLESVDLDFEPRWITKDEDGTISIYAERPECRSSIWSSREKQQSFGRIKLSEFENKDWQECIYEVPRKTTGKIEKIDMPDMCIDSLADVCLVFNKIIKKQNELVDAVNELKGAKNE